VQDLQPPGYRRFGGHVRRASRAEPLVREFTPSRWNQFGTKKLKRQGPKGGETAACRPAEDYRRNASECVRLAQNAQNPADKALLLKMAETWLRLAEQAEGRESKDPD
jgi:hypothetical protein